MKQPPTYFRKQHYWSQVTLLAGALLIQLLLAGNAFALDPAKDILQYNCRTWSRQNGLSVRGINAIAQTQDGYLWFGTSAGLVRYDGIEFSLLDLHSVAEVRNSVVTSLAGARTGGLWVGLENSAFGLYDGRSFSFRGGTNAESAMLNVRSILEARDGTLWLVTEWQAGRLNRSGELEPVLKSDSGTNLSLRITSCSEDRQGRFWFGTAQQGVYYWQSGKTTKLPDPEPETMTVSCITEDLDGNIWVGADGGLYCYNSKLERQAIPQLATSVRTLLVDRQGVLWIGTSGRGLVRYQKGTYAFLQGPDGLAGDFVQAIAEDHEGSLWVGTRDGISQVSDVRFPIQHAAEDLEVKDATSVGPSQQGGVWIASGGGLTRFDPKTNAYATQSGLPNSSAKRVLEAGNGDLYVVSGDRTLVVFSSGKTVATYVASNMVVGMAEDEQGVVVSVGGELYRAGTNYFQPYTFNNGELPPFYWIFNLASGRDGVIWVACANGVFRVKDGAYQRWSAETITDQRVYWVCEDEEGVVWAGLLSGIVRLKNNEARLINREHGLFDNNIYAVVPDDLGNLWVDSGRGIFLTTRQNMNDFADGKTNRVSCTVFDGVESVKVADKAVQERVGCKSTDGRIWFPGPRGVVMIDPAHIPVNRVAPPVHIDLIRGNRNEISRSALAVVPAGAGELEIHYNALTFIAPQKAQFRYRLEGYDKDWVEAGDRRMAFYTNLKPGHYTFRVIAANADGVWNNQGDRLEIELLPHFYQTAWFYVLCGGLICAGLAGSYAWRVRLLKRNQLFLQAEVRNRTAELAETNTSLHHEIAERKDAEVQLQQRTHSLENEIEERKRMEKEIERIHRQLLDTSRQAGMAEVATNVLHNVGNVLNSVNVSANLVVEGVKKSKLSNLARAVGLLREHAQDLGEFISHDPKGKQLPTYLAQLSEHLVTEQKSIVGELDSLRQNVEHIKEIVAMQQSYATFGGVKEVINVVDLVEDSLRMNEVAMSRHQVAVVREFEPVPPLNVEKHKILQILVNLLRNAKHACQDSDRADKRLTVRVANGEGWVKISVMDNGVGIPPENLNRIFNHGFTTRKDGHGFGLHSGALAAKEMGGSLNVHSDGIGCGATFTLELPAQPENHATHDMIYQL